MPATPKTLTDWLLFAVRALALCTPAVALICGNELIFPQALYVNIVWKHFTFRILVEAMFGLWAVLAWFDPRYRPRSSWILGCYAAFIAAITTADIAGLRPIYSFWGNFERMEGLIGHLHLFAFFLVVGCVFDSDRLWRAFFGVSLAVALFICCLAVWQVTLAIAKAMGAYDGKPFHQDIPPHNQGSLYLRADARLASPVYLGIYMLFHGFLAWWFAMAADRPRSRRLWGALAAFCVVVLYTTGSRIAYLGVVFGLVTALALLGAKASNDRWRRRARLALLVVGIVVAVSVVLAWVKPAVLSQIPLVRRLFGLEFGGAFGARALLAGMAWEGFAQHPLLGWGQENFGYIFNKYFDPALYSRELPDWWDHPHNTFLAWLCAGGVLAFVPYVGLYVSGFWYLWRSAGLGLGERCVWSGMLTGYTVFNLAQLDNLTSYLLFFAILARLHHKATARAVAAPARPAPVKVGVATALAVVLIGYAIDWVNVPAMRAGVAVGKAFEASKGAKNGVVAMRDNRPVPDVPRTIAAFEESLGQGSPMATSQVRSQLFGIVGEIVQSPNVSEAHKRDAMQLAVRESRAEIANNPGNTHDLVLYAQFLLGIGRPSDVAEAVQYLEEAVQLAPRRQLFWLTLGNAYAMSGRRQEAAQAYRLAWQLQPESKELRVQAAIGAVTAEDRALFDELLVLMRAEIRTEVFRVDHRLVLQMLAARWYAKVIELLEPVVEELKRRLAAGESMTDKIRERFWALAYAYSETGRRAEACELLQYAASRETAPKQREKWLAQARALGC